jgi:activator of HSP90 ATPase
MPEPKIQPALTKRFRRRQLFFGAAVTAGACAMNSLNAHARAAMDISRAAESIHDEVIFKSARKRVYEALTDSAQFHKVVLLSAAATTGMVTIKQPAEISKQPGGTFSLFGGYVTGRHIELIPGERIVQAWRNGSWAAGIYSIARFELAEDPAGTKLIFDHTGFPVGDAQHLSEGWKSNYWEPLAKFLAQ